MDDIIVSVNVLFVNVWTLVNVTPPPPNKIWLICPCVLFTKVFKLSFVEITELTGVISPTLDEIWFNCVCIF